MKYLNKFKIFESLISEGEFIDRYLDERKIKINKSGEIIYDGVVSIKNAGLKSIPVKFKSVDRYIMLDNNDLSNFSFLPDTITNVDGYGYHIGGNNLKGRFKEIVDILYKPNTGIYNEFRLCCMSVYFAKRGIFLNYFVRKFGSLIIVRIFGQAKEQNTMTTAQAISNEAYLKISNLSDLSDFNYAINRLKEITSMYGETKQSGLLMGRLIIKRDKLQ